MNRPRCALLFATSGHSGVDRIVANLLPELARVNADFDLLRIRGHGPYLHRLPGNVRDRPLPAAHRNTVLPSLVRYLRRETPAALLTASHRLNRAALQARWLARRSVRIAIRMGMTLEGQCAELGPRRGHRLLRSMHFWYPRADAVIAPSEALGDEICRHAGVDHERLHVIPNPIITPDFNTLARAPLAHAWFDADEPPVVLAAGSLEPRKDFSILLRAFARVRGERASRLVILGEGRERRQLESLARELGIAEDVHMPGYVSNPYRYMKRAAVFVLCSRREGSGAVLVEALACGTPAAATDCPVGPAEILRGGEVGPLVPIGDDVALAAAIERLLSEPPRADMLRAAAEVFRADRAAQRYLVALGLPAEAGP